jgi:hypothetical protein
VNQREAALQKCLEGGDCFGRGVRLLPGNGRDANGFGEPLNGCRVDWQWGRRLAQRLRREAERVEGENGNQDEQQDRCDECNALGRPQKSTLS